MLMRRGVFLKPGVVCQIQVNDVSFVLTLLMLASKAIVLVTGEKLSPYPDPSVVTERLRRHTISCQEPSYARL